MTVITVTPAVELVKEARQHVENLTADQVEQELQKRGVLLVDLRETEELRQSGKISGSVHAPRGMLEFYADPSSPYYKKEFDPSKRIILHCASGGRSALGAVLLTKMGYADVAHLDGGFKAWKESDKPIVQH
jgi:rhodanese-related sulfurtransferase